VHPDRSARRAALLLPGDLLGAALGALLSLSLAISDSFAFALTARASISRAARWRAASRRFVPAAGSASTSDFSFATRCCAAATASSRRTARLNELLPAQAFTFVPSTMISSRLINPSAMNAARLVAQQPVEHIGMGNAEVGEAVMVDGNAATTASDRPGRARSDGPARGPSQCPRGRQQPQAPTARPDRPPAGPARPRAPRPCRTAPPASSVTTKLHTSRANMIGGQPRLRIDQIPRQLRTIGPDHTSLAPHMASRVRHLRASRIDPSPGNHNSTAAGGISFTSSQAGIHASLPNACGEWRGCPPLRA